MQSHATRSSIPPALLRTFAVGVAAIVLGFGAFRAIGEWLAAWFSYGTYSALFTYGAVGVPAITYLVYSRRKQLAALPYGGLDLALGVLLLVLGCGLSLFSDLKDLRFLGIFLGVTALCVLQWGRQAPRLLWQELFLFLLAIPFPIVYALTHNTFFQQLTAHAASFMLYYSGIPAYTDGSVIQVQDFVGTTIKVIGGVTVAEKCSGTAIGFTLTYLGFLIPVLLPVPFVRRLLLALLGPFMALFCNAARVGFLVYVQTYIGKGAFLYWHEGDGRLVYSFSTMFLYGVIALWLVWPAVATPRPTPANPR